MQQRPGRQSLSVVIISLNAASQIEACLQSASFADEIVVVDSGSTDGTVEIAKRYGAKVSHQDWLGFGKQKQFAVNQASHDWVLCIDTDERVSEELRASIEDVLREPRFHAYKMPRRNRFMGRWLKHGEGYPDWSLRLFDRRYAGWNQDEVHERVVGGGTAERLKGDLLHESCETLEGYFAKQNRYSTIHAQMLYQTGKRVCIGQLFLSPLFRFIRFYFVRLGLLDGLPGFMHISIGCIGTFMKYGKIIELERKCQ